MIKNCFACLYLLLFLGQVASAQKSPKPKTIKVKGTYIHAPSNFVFATQIDQYTRSEITSFNGKLADKPDVGVTYQYVSKQADQHTTFTIYVYGAKTAYEDRLRKEYLSAVYAQTNHSSTGIHISKYPVSHTDAGFKTNGFCADVRQPENASWSRVVVFECGKWFYKLRITSNQQDTAHVNTIQKKLLAMYPPTKLVQIDPLNIKVDIRVKPGAMRDSTMLYAVLGGAFKKMSWASTHIDSLERCAGFPGMYLELHAESLKEMVKRWEEGKFSITKPSTDQYLSELKLIMEQGYLEEFILDQYDRVMIIPKGLELDLEGYQSWIALRPLSITLREKFYLISNAH